jgi:antitoxin component of MazEF toxin-antitoxin module
MQVSKWGNSLAIRLPASVVEALELKAGDEVEVHVAGDRAFDIDRDRSRARSHASAPFARSSPLTGSSTVRQRMPDKSDAW